VTDLPEEKVLASAKALFVERGYHKLGMRDMAKAGGRQPEASESYAPLRTDLRLFARGSGAAGSSVF